MSTATATSKVVKRKPRQLKSVDKSAAPILLAGKQPETTWIKVTPELATKWLEESNQNNRSVRDQYVARMAVDMKEGRWKRNGESIKFDVHGRMIDGQHRCWACVTAETSFETLMVTGVAEDVYATIDIGRTKCLQDFIGPMDGEKNLPLLGASLRLVYFWQRGLLAHKNNQAYFPTIAQLQITLGDHPKVRDSVNRVAGMTATRKILTGSFCTLIHYAGRLESRHAEVESFLERLGNGLGLMDDDPVYQLRRFLLAQKSSKPGMRRPGQDYILALAIKAWNASKEGKKIRNLKFAIDELWPQL